MIGVSESVKRQTRGAGITGMSGSTGRGARSRKYILLAAAVLGAVGGTSISSSAFAQNVYWDINGNSGAGSGATAGDASGIWDGVNQFWTTDSTGAAGTLSAEVGATNTGVFSAGSDATGTSNVTITMGTTHTVGGLRVEEGTVALYGSNQWGANADGINLPN